MEAGWVYHLGYKRNNWWYSEDYALAHSFDLDEIKAFAENERRQGSSFKILSVPIVAVHFQERILGIVPIVHYNWAVGWPEKLGQTTPKQSPAALVWMIFDHFNFYRLPGNTLPRTVLPNIGLRSQPSYRLQWIDDDKYPLKPDFERFGEFIERIAKVMWCTKQTSDRAE
jgi:hypothetical protein